MVWLTQALCGSALIGYAPYEQAGFGTRASFKIAGVLAALAVLGGIVSRLLIPHLGRQTLYLGGLASLLILLVASAIVSILIPISGATGWVVTSLVLGVIFVYNMSVGPVCYMLIAEIPSTRL